MGITRNGPVINMDTEQPLRMLPPTQRFTRAQAHRLLKTNKIPHDHRATMDHMLYLIQMNNIPVTQIPPGKLEAEDESRNAVANEIVKKQITEPVLRLVKADSLPNNVPKLRKMCKERKIHFKITDKKEDLIQKLNEYGKNTA